MAKRRQKREKVLLLCDYDLTPANLWQLYSAQVSEMFRRQRATCTSERATVRGMLEVAAYTYGEYIQRFITEAQAAEDAQREAEALRYVGQFWYGGQPRE